MPAGPAQRKGIKFLDIKILIASLSLAITIGFWNLFSIDAVRAERATPPALASDPPDGTASQTQDLPPLPTLVPLIELQELPAPAVDLPASQSVANPAPAQTGKLRSVSAPPVTIVQKNKPLVDAPVVGGGGGGGGGKSSKRSAARSRSS